MRLLILLFLFLASISSAQTDSLAVLQGQLLDRNAETLIGASVKITQNGKLVKGAITDYNGVFRVMLPPGIYDIEYSYTGYQPTREKALALEKGQIKMTAAVMKIEVGDQTTYYCPIPILDYYPGNSGDRFSAYQIRNMY